MKYNKFRKAFLVLTLSLTALVISNPIPTEASTVISPQVTQIQQASKPNTATSAKPAPNIKILINNQSKTLSDPIIMDNGRVFLPVRALGNLLNININYITEHNTATATNSKAHLELPLGYNKAVKDKSVILPIDLNNPNTRTILYNSRTYLPVRFISENLGYQISYANQTVSITTDGTTPIIPAKPATPTKPTKPTPDPSKPSKPGKANGEISKDKKWWWDGSDKTWREWDGIVGEIIDHGTWDPNGPSNGNWN